MQYLRVKSSKPVSTVQVCDATMPKSSSTVWPKRINNYSLSSQGLATLTCGTVCYHPGGTRIAPWDIKPTPFMDWITDAEIWASLLTLVIMEIVLGIDNIVFISIATGKLPLHQQKKGRLFGLGFALLTRIILLLSITWVMTLTSPLFNMADWVGIEKGAWHERLEISGRDLILIVGGLFLIYKSNVEIYDSLEGESKPEEQRAVRSFSGTVVQIGLLDIVFGLDSVITAIGMADHVWVMIAAVVVSMIFMMLASEGLSNFVNKHPSVKLLALAFLLLIGVSLIAEGIEQPIAKGYIYFAMGFSIFVEVLVLRLVKKQGYKRG